MRNWWSLPCGLCLVLLAFVTPAAQQTQFRVTSLLLIGSNALADGQLESTYRVQVENLGADASNVTATATAGRGHPNLVLASSGTESSEGFPSPETTAGAQKIGALTSDHLKVVVFDLASSDKQREKGRHR